MDIQNTETLLLLATLIFAVGVIGLIALGRSNKRSVSVKNGSGAFIAGDGNTVSVQIKQGENSTPATPVWKRVVAVISFLAAVAGPIIAALAYWFPKAGG